jgi:hypothetical protein
MAEYMADPVADPAAELTRAGVAKRLGCSVASVRRLEKSGELLSHPDEKGVRRFDAQEVERLIPRRTVAPRSSTRRDDGELAAAAFAMFERGVFDCAEVVKALRVPPATVDRLFAEWRHRDLRTRAEDRRREAEEAKWRGEEDRDRVDSERSQQHAAQMTKNMWQAVSGPTKKATKTAPTPRSTVSRGGSDSMARLDAEYEARRAEIERLLADGEGNR